MVTGERVMTAVGGWGPTWHRHAAAYKLSAAFLGGGPVLDLGCGVGHSYRLLAPRETVGVDRSVAALAGQERRTVMADMRSLPLGDASFASVIAVHSIEHVPDPERVLAEAYRVLVPGGVAVFVTPNRLTFGRPDEVVDPYHFIEYEAAEFERLLRLQFVGAVVHGLFGSPAMEALLAREHRRMERILRLDTFALRRRLPRRLRQRMYDSVLTVTRRRPDAAAAAISIDDFYLGREHLDSALDLVGIARRPLE